MIVYSQEMHSNLSHTKFSEAHVYTIQPNKQLYVICLEVKFYQFLKYYPQTIEKIKAHKALQIDYQDMTRTNAKIYYG